MWDQKIPSYIYGKQNIVRLILWTALFALVFINIYKLHLLVQGLGV